METDDYSRKKLGECKDHAADGKKAFNISAERKTDVIIQDLGWTAMDDKDLDTGKIIAAMLEIDDDDLQAEGGISALELAALSNVERSKLAANVLEKKLGQEKFDALSEKDKEMLGLAPSSELISGLISAVQPDPPLPSSGSSGLSPFASRHELCCLHNFTLDPAFPEYDVVEFIICHKRTLTHLTLDQCSIDGGEDGHFDRLWAVVLCRFEAELSALQMFSLTNGTLWNVEDSPRDPRFCYTFEGPGLGYITIGKEEVVGEEGDDAALKSLMATVEARRTHRC
ncbi:hypothetical protein B0H13DRAFT_2306573 [Mycena leptocephala]|nr:hypothetical protein B0H13DRAFT_2306573 [Mycena leptocephala]